MRAQRKYGALAILASGVIAMFVAGCGEGTPPTPAPVSAAQGSSFDAPVAPKAAEPKEDVAVVPEQSQPASIQSTPPVDKTEVIATPAAVEPQKPAIEPQAPSEPSPLAGTPATSPALPAKKPAPPVQIVPAPKVVEPEPKKETAKDAANDPPMAITFAKLGGYRYYPPASRTKPGEKPVAKSAIPEAVRALDGRKVSIEGYMIPIDFQKGKIMSFILSKAMFGCCYGDSPQINEVIKVVSADGKPMSYLTMPRVTGILEVGEEFDSEGYIDSIYRIKADAVTAGKDR